MINLILRMLTLLPVYLSHYKSMKILRIHLVANYYPRTYTILEVIGHPSNDLSNLENGNFRINCTLR